MLGLPGRCVRQVWAVPYRRPCLWLALAGGLVLARTGGENTVRYAVADEIGVLLTIGAALALFVPWVRRKLTARRERISDRNRDAGQLAEAARLAEAAADAALQASKRSARRLDAYDEAWSALAPLMEPEAPPAQPRRFRLIDGGKGTGPSGLAG